MSLGVAVAYAAESSEFVPWIAPLITVLFGAGGLVALLKIRPEAGQIAVNVAETVMKRLEREVERLAHQVEEQAEDLEKCHEIQQGYAALITENATLRAQSMELEDAFERVTNENVELRKRLAG